MGVPRRASRVGESLDKALKREILEESGIYVTIRKMVGMYSNIQKTTWHDGKTIVPTKLTIDYICDYTGGTVRTSDETSDVRWVTIDEAQKLIDYPIFALRLKNMLNFDGNIVYEVFQSQPYIHIEKNIY